MTKENRFPLVYNRYKVTDVTSDYTIKPDDDYLYIDATGGDIVVTVPSIAAVNTIWLLLWTIRRIDSSSNTVTIRCEVPTDSIYGSSNYSISLPYQGNVARIESWPQSDKYVLYNGAFTTQDAAWDDLLINSGVFKFSGSADPTLQDWQPGSSGATFKVYKFKKNDEIYFSCQLPHTYKQGTDLKVHVHWTPCDRGVAEDGKYVGWKLDYSWANINGDPFPASGTIDMHDTCSGVNDYHEVSAGLTSIDGTDKTISSMLVGRLYRTDTGTDDTWVGTTASQSPAVLQFDIHHQIDTIGSRIEWVK